MTRIINAVTIYNGTSAITVDVASAETLKIQAVGSGAYTVKGRLASDKAYDSICAIRANDFTKKTEVTDDNIYSVDVAGYSQVTVDATGFTSIYAILIG